MACSVRILPSAEEEVSEIVAHLKSQSDNAARRFISAYQKKLELLSTGIIDFGLSHLPELARLGYHACRAENYIILYCHDTNGIVIVHVFHQSRDYARLVLPLQTGKASEERRGEFN